MRILHSSMDNFPFRYSGSIRSAVRIATGLSNISLDITGIEISPSTPPRRNFPQAICLYQNLELAPIDSSLVRDRSSGSSGLGSVLIRSYQRTGRSLTKTDATIEAG